MYCSTVTKQGLFIRNRKTKELPYRDCPAPEKTELLLHKLKDIYIASKDKKIIFTCHNKILADSLRTRIPDFFNFMRVEEQIRWNKRLWYMHGAPDTIEIPAPIATYEIIAISLFTAIDIQVILILFAKGY